MFGADKVLEVISKGKMGSIIVMKDNKLQYKATSGYISNETKKIGSDIQDILDLYKRYRKRRIYE